MIFTPKKSARTNANGENIWHKLWFSDYFAYRDAVAFCKTDNRACRGYWNANSGRLWVEAEEVAIDIMMRFPTARYWPPAGE